MKRLKISDILEPNSKPDHELDIDNIKDVIEKTKRLQNLYRFKDRLSSEDLNKQITI